MTVVGVCETLSLISRRVRLRTLCRSILASPARRGAFKLGGVVVQPGARAAERSVCDRGVQNETSRPSAVAS